MVLILANIILCFDLILQNSFLFWMVVVCLSFVLVVSLLVVSVLWRNLSLRNV